MGITPLLPMEKSAIARGIDKARHYRFGTSLLATAVVILWWTYPLRDVDILVSSSTASKPSSEAYRWSDITPSKSLKFVKCYERYECARLDVPLDWRSHDKRSIERAAVAITRLPAKVPVTSPRYGGAILINPGGPGGSGVSTVTRSGEEIQTIVDKGKPSRTRSSAEEGFYYDIIGFDPRGVNNTTPSSYCFPDDASREFWAVQSQAQGLLSSNDSFPYVWGRTQALAISCSQRLGEDGIGKHMNTPVVVKDMVAIIEALGEWREREAEALSKQNRPFHQRQAISERTKWRKGSEKLLYWGFSYGTLLGATFASMYPDKVGRVVLDGVVDAEDYYAGTWLSNLQDTDSIVASFMDQCYQAGPELCDLWSSSGPEGSRKVYNTVLQGLSKNPLPVPAIGKYGPDLITWTDAMFYVKNALYQPMDYFKGLARIMDALSQGNGTELAALKQNDRTAICRSPSCEGNPYSNACHDPQGATFKSEISAAILCTDAPASMMNWTAQDHFNKWQVLRRQSTSFADYWAEITMYCGRWHLRPAWELMIPIISSNKTANPLLFVSNTRDPVTPLRNAAKMQRMFEGSGLLVQDADGHCSMSAPGVCVAQRIRDYFQKGQLPEAGLKCVPDFTPFESVDESTDKLGDDNELCQAVAGLRESLGRNNGLPLHI